MRIAIFVDVQNAFFAARNAYDGKLDYGEMLKGITGKRELIRATAYMTKRADIDQSRFCSALTNLGYEMKHRDAKQRVKEGKTMFASTSYEVMLTVDAISMSSKIDTVVLVSGGSCYVPLINYLKGHGCRVEIVGFNESTSGELIKAADKYTSVPKHWVFQDRKESAPMTDVVDGDGMVDEEDKCEEDEVGSQPRVDGQPSAFGVLS